MIQIWQVPSECGPSNLVVLASCNLLKVPMPCPFTGPKMFWAGPNFLCQTKNLFTYCGSHKHFVPEKKDDLHSVKLVFVPAQKFLKRH